MPQNSSWRATCALERDDLRPALQLGADVGEHLPQAIEVERLGEVFARAELDRLDRAVDGGVAGHQDHFAAGHRRADLPQQIEAVDVGHPQVDHREIGRLARQQRASPRAPLAHGHRRRSRPCARAARSTFSTGSSSSTTSSKGCVDAHAGEDAGAVE